MLANIFSLRSVKSLLFSCQLMIVLLLSISNVGCINNINNLNKSDFDIEALDEQGLLNGVAVDFEFCVANSKAVMAQIAARYPNLQFMTSSPGRIGCHVQEDGQGEQVLVIGSTLVPQYREHFRQLLASDEITAVKRVYWE
ncbi:hypothetical protein Q4519_11665 [Motilimonas sp. 1_MG-2023]|uniref:hypothetical protein n=1 Tax=Motilimonas sp. 1_MG-2023 TaxID=3062672 RepID=UPI0026E1AE1E|nr:hypothetical protein [Motilimonas sp. 1_MG-2023]MDO6526341.1 hypothetical protein [Motilimonas sp. 1_MG-2023]